MTERKPQPKGQSHDVRWCRCHHAEEAHFSDEENKPTDYTPGKIPRDFYCHGEGCGCVKFTLDNSFTSRIRRRLQNRDESGSIGIGLKP